jgi:hypothetical protein
MFQELGLNVAQYLLQEQKGKRKATFAEVARKVPEVTVKMSQLIQRGHKLIKGNSEDQRGPELKKPKIIMIANHDKKWEQEKREAQESWAKYWSDMENTKKYNKTKGKNEFPKCEVCFKFAFLSGHATKVVCEKQPLNYCYTCYNKLPVLDEHDNRRLCPNHHKCVAFESLADRKRWKSEEEEFSDYFREKETRCKKHPNIELIGPYDGACRICDKDKPIIEERVHQNLQFWYKVGGWVAAEWARTREAPEEPDFPVKRNPMGEMHRVFVLEDSPIQKETKKNVWKAKSAKEKAEKELEEIFARDIPENYFWLRKKLKENQDQTLYAIQQSREVLDKERGSVDPLRICFGCRDIGYDEEIRNFPNLEWLCKSCYEHPDLIYIKPEHDKDYGKLLSRGARKRQQKKMKR